MELWKQINHRLEIKNPIKTALAAVLSYYAAVELSFLIHRGDYITSGLWASLASIVVLQSNLGATNKAILNRFLGVLIGSGFGALFVASFGANPLVLGLAIFCTMVVCSLLNLKDSYRIASLSVAFIIIPWNLSTSYLSPWSLAFFRFLDTTLGLLVAMIVAYVLWPVQAITKIRANLLDILSLIKQYYRYVFMSTNQLQQKEKTLQELTVEINQEFNQTYLAFDESRLEFFSKSPYTNLWHNFMIGLERIADNLIAIKNVYRPNLENMFDDELRNFTNEAIETINQQIKELAVGLREEKSVFHVDLLQKLKSDLNDQMLRFRQTRVTKQYNLEVVESYFVFFYSLRSIIEELILLKEVAYTLQAENGD